MLVTFPNTHQHTAEGGLIRDPEDFVENLKQMMSLRKDTLIEDVDDDVKALWEWYCLELMRRVSRKDWRWGREENRKDQCFSICVWPSDEAFVMANLEAKIEHYCEIRKAMANNTFRKQEKRGRTLGKKQKDEEGARQLGEKYEAWRTSVKEMREGAIEKRMVSKEHDRAVSVQFSWDHHIKKAAARRGDHRKSNDGETRFNDMIFEADEPPIH